MRRAPIISPANQRRARLEGGYLDAGQGTDGRLNLKGSALTVSVRLRNPSVAWGKPLFSKHGGHDRLIYDLFSFESAIGFELGLRNQPGMTQVMAPLARIGPQDWHTVICRYDGTNLQMFVDGVLMSEAAAAAAGPLPGKASSPVPLHRPPMDLAEIESGPAGRRLA
jgi:hypothetical protein